MSFPLPDLAQSPGGVSGCEAWFVTSPSGTDSNGPHRWLDISGDSVPLLHRGGQDEGQEVFQSRDTVQSFNFHPAVRFTPSSGFMDVFLRHENLAQTTVVGVFAPDSQPSTDTRLYSIAGKDTTVATKDKVFHSGEAAPLDYSPDLLHAQEMATALKVVCWQSASKPQHSPWGEQPGTSLSMGGPALSNNPVFTEPINGLGVTPGFSGWCPEMIIYGRTLSPCERATVETYLALKYGISLDNSYILRDRLLWDADDGSWHRIAGVLLDSASCLRQSLSTTSYEEPPRQSTLPVNDSFHGRNSYSKATASRLLVMGRSLPAGTPDGTYMIWGDDGMRADTVIPHGRWHSMPRSWIVRTNVDTTAITTPAVTATGMELSSSSNVYNLMAGGTGTPFLRLGPSTSADLRFSFTFPSHTTSFDVGVTTEASPRCRYGYRFGPSGAIYKITDFVESSSPVVNDATGRDIDVCKIGDDLYIQVDGAGSASYNIKVPVREIATVGNIDRLDPVPDPATILFKGYTCEGAVSLAPGDTLRGLRVEGFSDTGAYVELGYDIAAQGFFKPHRLGRTWLLASGAGGTRAYHCTGFSSDRKKTLFHNIPLADRDTLRFAWHDGILADVEADEATCQNSTPLPEGVIRVRVRNCSRGLHVEVGDTPLTPSAGNTCSESERAYTQSGFLPGTYLVTIRQDSTCNLHAWATSEGEVMQFNTPYGGNDFSWSHQGTSTRSVVGFGKNSSSGVWYGVKMRNDTAWYVFNGMASYPTRVSGEVPVRIRVSGTKVYVSINSVERNVSGFNINNFPVFRARFSQGEAHLWNLSGFHPTPSLSSDRLLLETIAPDTLRYEVHIGSPCAGGDTYVTPLDGNDAPVFRSLTKPGTTAHEHTPLAVSTTAANPFCITATLAPEAADGPVQMMVFDISGKLHSRGKVLASPPYTETLVVGSPGVYIVKAVTGSAEHTVKVACGQ